VCEARCALRERKAHIAVAAQRRHPCAIVLRHTSLRIHSGAVSVGLEGFFGSFFFSGSRFFKGFFFWFFIPANSQKGGFRGGGGGPQILLFTY